MLRRLSMFFIFALAFAFATDSVAASAVPSNLNAVERQKTLEVLGFGAASKLLSSPYPLGGYSGVEISVGSEYIPMSDVATLGAKSASKGDLNFLSVTVGKGLFYNVDLFLHFIPNPQDAAMSGFGGQMRWGFYEANFMPAALSLVAHTASVNFSNVLGVDTTGVDLVGSVNMKDVSLFVGLGQARSRGAFVGGVNGVTSSGQSESADVNSSHTLFGISINMGQVFLAMQIDRYIQSTYGGKLGWRF